MKNYIPFAERIFAEATINKTSAQLIKSSVHITARDARLDSTRLDSIYAVFPKMVIGERNRHRPFSLSDRSSRAVPPEKLFDEIRSGEWLAMPAKFKRRIKGMGGGEELTGDELIEAQLDWITDALNAANGAERANKRGEAKETVNRRLDPFIYMHTLQTATQNTWLNFFGLRLANADPTIEVLAQKCFEVYKAAQPERLALGMWHRPFVTDEEEEEEGVPGYGMSSVAAVLNRLSAARCAHLSYNDLETGKSMSVERAMNIAHKLEELRHPSPFEHQATPDSRAPGSNGRWRNPEQWGNFYGWRQARKMMLGEAVAPLPEGYEL